MEIYGPEASGKTALALHVIAEAQKQGGYYLFLLTLRLCSLQSHTSYPKEVFCIQEPVSL